MTRLGRFFRNLLERLLDRFHEGPLPPVRIGEEVRLFAALHPDADKTDWIRFATRNANRAYRDGFTRGFEYSERFWPGPITDPALILAAQEEQVSLAETNPRLKAILELGYDPLDPFGGLSLADRKARLEAIQAEYWPGGVRRGRHTR